jgi:hypothetical protein
LEILPRGRDEWNSWRASNPAINPSLRGADLVGTDLAGFNLSGADLSGADLDGVDMTGANMKMASLARADLTGAKLAGAELYKAGLRDAFGVGSDLSGAYLAEADLAGADLRGADLSDANLSGADLSDANLSGADLSGADLSGTDVRCTDMSLVILDGANVNELRYGPFSSMRGHYFGVRGLTSCHGNALFVRDAQDQDYLETLKRSIDQSPQGWRRRMKQMAFEAWALIDFGRSLAKPAMYALIIASAFGVLYSFDSGFDWGLMDYSGSADTPLSPFYYSIVTYTTLGFGDITPQDWLGEIIVVAEVVLGYTTLGLLLSILANRVARQS